MRAGLITREQAKNDRMKNVITRSVGFEPVIDVETYQILVKPGDILLLCSDGLSGMVSDLEMVDRVRRYAMELNDPSAQSMNWWIWPTKRRDDNVTVLIIKVVG